MIRPYTEKFLREMSKLFEIVIFTAAMDDYANWTINLIDRFKYVSHRLYR